MCNDPCRISGFREPLSGSLIIVETRREADLLTTNDRLRSQLFGARREARRAERRLAEAEGELEAQLAFGGEEREQLVAEIDRLETQLASARSREADTGRTPFDPWVVGAILLVTLAVAALAFRHGRVVPAMTDLSRQRIIGGWRKGMAPSFRASTSGPRSGRAPGSDTRG